MKDLYRWTYQPIDLLRERAGRADTFPLRLWRRALVGYRPEWNRAVLSDPDTFRSRGSLSGLTPYLRGGVVYLDQPRHDPRRRALNPAFHARALSALTDRLDAVVAARLPVGEFDAVAWSSTVVRHLLNAAFFDGALPDHLLRRFLAPLHLPTPAPLRPRPVLFRRVRSAIEAVLADPPPGTLAEAVVRLHATDSSYGGPAPGYGPAQELRVALAAGYDTTAYTLAWAIWQLAHHPQWSDAGQLPRVLDETLRLYPAGWIGSRVAGADATVAGRRIRKGTLVLYSPLLTHRDPRLWDDPDVFRPDRFAGAHPPAWAFLPFAGGSRTCLGMHLARLMLSTALTPLCERGLTPVGGDPSIAVGITIRPRGPLLVRA